MCCIHNENEIIRIPLKNVLKKNITFKKTVQNNIKFSSNAKNKKICSNFFYWVMDKMLKLETINKCD